MMGLAALLTVIWLTIAWEKPWALLFAMSIMAVGLAGRWVAHNRERVREWFLAPVPTFLPAPEGAAVLPVRRAESPNPGWKHARLSIPPALESWLRRARIPSCSGSRWRKPKTGKPSYLCFSCGNSR